MALLLPDIHDPFTVILQRPPENAKGETILHDLMNPDCLAQADRFYNENIEHFEDWGYHCVPDKVTFAPIWLESKSCDSPSPRSS